MEEASKKVIEYINKKDSQYDDLTMENSRLSGKINSLTSTMDSVLTEFEKVIAVKNDLQAKVDEYVKEKREFQDVADLFTMSEAEVFKDGSNIVIRLLSLNFDAGKSIIDPQYFCTSFKSAESN